MSWLEVSIHGQVVEQSLSGAILNRQKPMTILSVIMGPKKKPGDLVGRAASTGNPQGQWLKEQGWVIAEQLIPKHSGSYVIDFKRPIGRVYYPDGTIIDDVTHAFVQRRPDGTINSAYPVTDDFVIT